MLAGASKPQTVARSLSPGKRIFSTAPEAPRGPNPSSSKLAPRVSIIAAKQSIPTSSTISLSAPRAPPVRNSITQSTLTHRRTSTIATSRPSTVLRPRESVAPSTTKRISTLGSAASGVNRRESVLPPLPTFPKKPVRSSTISGLSTRASETGLTVNRGSTVAQRRSSTLEVAKSIPLTAKKVTTSIISTSSARSRTPSSVQPIHTPQVTSLPSHRALRRTSSVGAASGEGLKAAAAARQAIASRPRPSTSLGRMPASHSSTIRPLKARPSTVRPSASESKLDPAIRTSTTRAGGKL